MYSQKDNVPYQMSNPCSRTQGHPLPPSEGEEMGWNNSCPSGDLQWVELSIWVLPPNGSYLSLHCHSECAKVSWLSCIPLKAFGFQWSFQWSLLLGPFLSLPVPIGVVLKKMVGKFYLIHRISFPKGHDAIPDSLCSVQYTPFNQAVRLVHRWGLGVKMAKYDIKSVYLSTPWTLSCWCLLLRDGTMWTSLYSWDAQFLVQFLNGSVRSWNGPWAIELILLIQFTS